MTLFTRRITLAAAAVAALVGSLLPATAAHARTHAPHLRALRCVPGCHGAVRVRAGRRLQVSGTRLSRGMRVTFFWGRRHRIAKLRRSRIGWTVVVPRGTGPGRVTIRVRGRGGHSNALRLVVPAPPKHRAAPPAPAPAAPAAPASGTLPAAFQGAGMWVWQLGRSSGGDPAAIAAQARAAGISTVFVKSADGRTPWAQFGSALVQALHAQGLRVCGWQYVYGSDPLGEARAGAVAASLGADCLVIDAETQYEGRYAAAQRYVQALRAAVGPSYPIGFTSFPYVDYHPGLPFSVFLGPGGAQANLPQVYWRTIGGTVDAVSAHTWMHNRIYGAPVAPLGQTYQHPPAGDLQRFRSLWTAYGAAGLSWWDWQETAATAWTTLAQPVTTAVSVPDPGWPALHRGSKGDEVVWLQEHLQGVAPGLAVDGDFGAATKQALAALQSAAGLPPTGVADPPTWQAVLAQPLQPVDWTLPPGRRAVAATAGRAPRSARLPARRDEIPAARRGQGRPRG